MAELTLKDQLQPALLDRLTDDDPGDKQEARAKRTLTMKQMRQSVLRDMGWLLNTVSLAALEDLTHHEEVQRSTLNYGVPDFSGRSLSINDLFLLEQKVRQAIHDFEPRILPDSLKIRLMDRPDQMNANALSFEIEGDLWAQPLPIHLFIRSELDLERGSVELTDLGG